MEKNANEVAKYRKKKKSSVSSSKLKSKHKHKYCDCLLIYDGYPYKGKYCIHCGKLKWNCLGDVELLENNYIRLLTKEEVFEKNKELPHFEVDDCMQKFVSLTCKNVMLDDYNFEVGM